MSFLVAVVVVATAGCAAATAELDLVGIVDEQTASAQIPWVVVPAVNLDAGFPPSAANEPKSTAPTVATFVRVTQVDAAVGDHVTAGQPLVHVDDSALKAQLAAAQANQAVAEAQVGVIDQHLADADSAAATLADKKREIEDAIDQATEQRATLEANLEQAQAGLEQLQSGRAQLSSALKAALKSPVPPVPALAQQRAASIAMMQAQLAQLDSQLAALQDGITKLTDGIAQIDAALVKARDGLAKIESAQADLADARLTLEDLKRLAEASAGLSAVAVDVVAAQIAVTVVTAPADGIVTAIVTPGAVLAPGATAVTVRQTPTTVTTWVSPERAALFCTSDTARLAGDWAPTSPVRATLTRIGTETDYPPNVQATDETHLARAIALTFTFDGTLPAGIPVEIHTTPCHATR